MVEYDRLSINVICALTGELLPDTSWHDPERSQQRIAIAVCDATGMTPERWDKLTKDERIPWLHKTLKKLEKQPAPNVWIEGDDLPVYRPDLAREPLEDSSPSAGSKWPDPTLDPTDHVKQVMYAHTMVGLSRGKARNPAVTKDEWDALETVSVGVPVDTSEKFDLWLEGTASFFRLLVGDKNCVPWLEDAYRIARRLDPNNAPQPNFAGQLDGKQALIELEALRIWSRSVAHPRGLADRRLPRSDDGSTDSIRKRSTERGTGQS